jgi:hypothetical protein
VGSAADADKLGVGQIATVHTLWQKTNKHRAHSYTRVRVD